MKPIIKPIKGYNKLSPVAKDIFDKVYLYHQNGVEDKAAWTAVKVQEKKTHIRVTFKNGEWLHYMPNGSWY